MFKVFYITTYGTKHALPESTSLFSLESAAKQMVESLNKDSLKRFGALYAYEAV
jgi:hypothetical protein